MFLYLHFVGRNRDEDENGPSTMDDDPLNVNEAEDDMDDNDSDDPSGGSRRRGCRTKLTLREYAAYQIMFRPNSHDSLLQSGRLLQEWLVDTYARIESQRLTWHRENQDKLRADLYQNVHRAALNGETAAREIGTRIILPSTFMGGPRYMIREYQDAMAIVRGKH